MRHNKVAYIIFPTLIIGLILNILYIGTTGKHIVSGFEIQKFAKSRGKVKDIVQAQRGEIISSDNEVIANTVKKYKIIAYTSNKRAGYGKLPAYVQDATKTAQVIAPLLGIEESKMATKLQTAIDKGSWQVEFGKQGSNINTLVKDKIMEQMEVSKLTGIDFIEENVRNYPMGDFASYILGYAQLKMQDKVKMIKGEMGIERYYNTDLSGENGYQMYQIDAKGNRLPNGMLEEKKVKNGSSIYLTINASLQRSLDIQLAATAKQVGASNGASAVMEVKTGKILAMSNYPSFDPNARDIRNYQNFFFEQTYECGSVFKPFTYASIIEDGKYKGNDTYETGIYEVSGKKIGDWHRSGWGRQTFDNGLALSSNTAIANLVDRYADHDVLSKDYQKLGFFTKSTIDKFDSPSGIALFKTGKRLDYITSGFGQGSTVTPLQLLRAYSVFGNDGRTVEPYFIDRLVDGNTKKVVYASKPKYSDRIFSTKTIEKMNQLLLNNIENPSAVAKNYRLDTGVKMMGKTGTGQIASKQGYRTDSYSMSFAGLAPADKPEIVIINIFQCADKPGVSNILADFSKSIMIHALASKTAYTDMQSEGTAATYDVDSFTNQSVSYVSAKLKAKKIQPIVLGNGNSVVDQFPAASSVVSSGDRIFLKTDSDIFEMPNMIGWSRKDVQVFASLSGLSVAWQGEATGIVTKQGVTEGTPLSVDHSFSVTLSNQ